MVFTIALKDPIGPDDGDQNEGNEDVVHAYFQTTKQKFRKFGDHPIPNSQFFTGET